MISRTPNSRKTNPRPPVCAALLAFALLVFTQVPAAAQADTPPPLLLKRDFGELAWRNIAPGLESLELQLNRQNAAAEGANVLTVSVAAPGVESNMVIVRADPDKCEFSLHMASENGRRRSLRACAEEYGLDAAINAGMYLPDNLKNTGFMRNATHVNNSRIVANFGAFFLAGPNKKTLPQAILTEKNELGDKLEQKIADYTIAVQNYRLTNAKGDVLWPESRDAYSISALGRDKRGRILLIAAEYRLSAPDFTRLVLSLPLNVDLMMYLEGGTQAGLALLVPVTEPDLTENGGRVWRVWRGRHVILSGLGNDDAELPNVLGVRSLAGGAGR